MKFSRTTTWIIVTVSFFFLCSCGGGGSSDSGSTTPGSSGTGTLSLSMVDAPGGSYKAVYVTIREVQVCMQPIDLCAEDTDDCGCRWETLATLNRTYNLLELVNGVMATLGQKNIEAGTYNQMRLLLRDQPDDTLNLLGQAHIYPQYLIDADDGVHEMKVPSGYQTGIKLVHPFEIVSDLTTELILDFDVARSVVKAGKSGKYLLKPTIKVIGTHNRAVVSGVVTTNDLPPAPLEGAQVTAWYQDSEDDWSVGMRTVTNAVGEYMLYLDLGGDFELDTREYKIVATAEGYDPSCLTLAVQADQTYPDTDFALLPTEMVTVEGTITGTAPLADGDVYPDEAPIVTVSFSRQDGDCALSAVETAFVQATDDADVLTTDVFYSRNDGSFQFIYSITIPAGLYDVTASSDGLAPVSVTDTYSADAVLDFDFPAALN